MVERWNIVRGNDTNRSTSSPLSFSMVAIYCNYVIVFHRKGWMFVRTQIDIVGYLEASLTY